MAPRKRFTSSRKKKVVDSDEEQQTTITTPAQSAEAVARRSASLQQQKNNNSLNPVTTTLEWNGVPGAFATVLLLPCVVFLVNALCSTASSVNQCSLSWFTTHNGGFSVAVATFWHRALAELSAAMPRVPEATAILLGWYLFHCAFYLWFPLGERGPGMKLRNGKTLNYNFSAFWSMIVTYAVAIAGHFYFRWFDWGALTELYLPMAIASIILSVLFSVMLYAASFRAGDDVLLATGGNSGYAIYDFFVGRELNPRLGELDFKFMFELRPGLIGWTLIAWAFVIRSAEGPAFAAEGGYKALGMLPIYGAALCNVWYVLEGLYFEPGNVTMMDIVHDGFGFMLCFGDLAWVPFLYALQCKFLFMYPAVGRATPIWYTALCAALYVAGYLIFRGANSQKDRFRKDPKDPRVRYLKTISTKRGTKLIVSGFWGVCRHPNYVGDWLMVVATSMFCGAHVLPYFQVIYFAILLIHRQLRDEDWMMKKYGQHDWERYCEKVPYRLIPYVY